MCSNHFTAGKITYYKQTLRTGWTSDIRLSGVLPPPGEVQIFGHVGFDELGVL